MNALSSDLIYSAAQKVSEFFFFDKNEACGAFLRARR